MQGASLVFTCLNSVSAFLNEKENVEVNFFLVYRFYLCEFLLLHIFFPTLNENFFKFFTLFSVLSQVFCAIAKLLSEKCVSADRFVRAFSRKTATRRAE